MKNPNRRCRYGQRNSIGKLSGHRHIGMANAPYRTKAYRKIALTEAVKSSALTQLTVCSLLFLQALGEMPIADKPSFKALVPFAFHAIERAEYDIQWQPQIGAYQAPNRANNLRFTFWDDGFSVEPRAKQEIGDEWSASFILELHGQKQSKRLLSKSLHAETKVSRNTAIFMTDDVVVQYENDTNGLHQSFLVLRRPHGGLVLDLVVDALGLEMLPHES